ncbi:adenylate/guanylate cyclase domain-containing protein [Chryseolinea sp. T2]|uniref:adenylate/guanylate cyclase domain-containing protein n=1 Tax=Chryseolinea sp. T2 TaxID=3129255 RepID=UPI003078890C
MQLPLFMSPKPAIRGRKKTNQIQSQAWDLWNQPAEPEQEMALMFVDIRNFTPLTGQFRPSDVLHLIGKLLSTFQRLVRNNHGRIIETTGDGFYAAFGFDGDIGRAVDDAVRAGSSIMRQLAVLNASGESQIGRKIEVGIGIHVGKVATGKISLNGYEHLLVMGHAVNIAARLQGATKQLNNNFLVSSVAFELLKQQPSESESAHLTLKGVDASLEVRMIGEKYAA